MTTSNENVDIITDALVLVKVENKTSQENVIENIVSNEASSSLSFTRDSVEELGNLVHLVDSDEDAKLDMFCYVKCTNEDSDLLKKCRGVVFNESTLVLKAFPYTIEYNNTQTKDISDVIGDFKKWNFFESHEGALLRVFYFGGKWYVSTHRKLNAFRSKWASRDSFGTSFKDALISEEENNPVFKKSLPIGDNILERFQSTLDKTKQYMFLVRNSKDNRIVCAAPARPTVYHVGTFIDGKLCINDHISIPSPTSLTFDNINNIQSYVEKLSYNNLQGVIGFHVENNKQLKIVNVDYQDLFNVRGNEPSIKFRYLQVRMMSKRSINMLYHLYPELSTTFDEYENTLYDIGRSIYRAYVQRFIKKRYVTVPKEEFSIIRECHTWHLSNRTENRISLDQIINVMNKQTPTNLNHMIRRFKLEQSKQIGEQLTTHPRSDSIKSAKSYEKSPVIKNFNGFKVDNFNLSNEPNKIQRVASISIRKPIHIPKIHVKSSD